MLKEEQVLFPYVRELEAAAASGAARADAVLRDSEESGPHDDARARMCRRTSGGPARRHERLHATESACFSDPELYRRLAEFELRTHARAHREQHLLPA